MILATGRASNGLPCVTFAGVFGSNCAQKWSFDFFRGAPTVDWDKKVLQGSLDDPLLTVHAPVHGLFDVVVCTEVS